MKRKFLEDLALEGDVVDKIMTENGKDITTLKAKVDDLTEQISVKETTIQDKNTKIAELEKVDIEAIKKQAKEEGIAEGSKELETFKKQNVLNEALAEFKAKDSKIISTLIDMEKIKYGEDGKIVEGLEEQMKALKESHDYLFASDKSLPQFADKTPGAKMEIKGSASLTEALKEKFN